MKFKPEQLNPDAPLPIEETTDTVSYLGVELKKGSGGDRVPNPKQFENDIITDFDLKLMQRVAVALSLNQPVLVESGSGIGKSQMVDRICHDLNRECYYANCHDYDADTLIGSQTSLEGTTSGFGWKDGVIIEAARKGGILFLDEYNFMRGDTRGRLHEVLDTILRGKGEIALTENHNEIVKVHPDFRVVAAQNPPGGEYGDREVLDPAQIDRFVYIKEVQTLPEEVRTARLLGRMGLDNKITIPAEFYMTQGEGLSDAEMASIPGIADLFKKYVEVSRSLQAQVQERTLARNSPQPISFGSARDDRRVYEFIGHFYRGDINKTFQDALRFYYLNKVMDDQERASIEAVIRQVKYVPKENSNRRDINDIKKEKEKKTAETEKSLDKVKQAEADLAYIKEKEAELKHSLRKSRRELDGETVADDILVHRKTKDVSGKEITEMVEVSFEGQLSNWLEFYKTHDIKIDKEKFTEKMRDIWERNYDKIVSEVERAGFNKVLFIPDELPDLIELDPSMTKGYDKEKGNKTYWGVSVGDIIESNENARIILVHDSVELDDIPELKETLGKKAEFFIDKDEMLTLSEYFVLQREIMGKTGKHIDANRATWTPGSKAGSEVVYAYWNPDNGQFRVYSYAPDSSAPNIGCRLSRCFQ
jgi:MoxR-like ATPase